MKIRKILPIITFFLLFGQTFLTAQNNQYSNMAVSIKFSNRTIYYPNNTESNPINIHITIKNKGTDTLRFKLADNRLFSLDFHAYTVKNKQLKQTDNLIEKRTTNQTVYFREIALEGGEEYSFIENVKDYIKVEDPSVYYLEMSFYHMKRSFNAAVSMLSSLSHLPWIFNSGPGQVGLEDLSKLGIK